MPATTTPEPTTTLSPEELLRAEELANAQAAVVEDNDDTTARPVMVYYAKDAKPDDLHPLGVVAGTMFESPTPAIAKQFHPNATILRYADGSDYNARKANAEIRETENTEK